MTIWVAMLVIIAAALFVLELLIPSGGILGLLSIIALIGAVITAYAYDTTTGHVMLIISLVLIPSAIAIALKVFPHTPVGRRLILSDQSKPASEKMQSREGQADQSVLIDAEGQAVTDLRPVGTCQIKDVRVECTAESGIIDRGTAVRVIATDGLSIKVRAIDA